MKKEVRSQKSESRALAGVLCRHRLMTGETKNGSGGGHYDLPSWQLGELDYADEMRLVVGEISVHLRSSASQ